MSGTLTRSTRHFEGPLEGAGAQDTPGLQGPAAVRAGAFASASASVQCGSLWEARNAEWLVRSAECGAGWENGSAGSESGQTDSNSALDSAPSLHEPAPMSSSWDAFAKEVIPSVVAPVARVETSVEAHTDTQFVDLVVTPTPGVDWEAAFAPAGR